MLNRVTVALALMNSIPLDQFLMQRLNQPTLQIQVKTQDAQIQVFLQSNPTPKAALAALIHKHLKTLELKDVETIRVYGMQSARIIAWKKEFQYSYLTKDDLDPYSFNNRFISVIAFPISILFALITNTDFFQLLFRGTQLWIHEFGHATVGWLSGHRAIPLPFGFTPVAEERSTFVYFGVLFLLGLLFWTGHKEKKPWAMGCAIVLSLLQFYMTWIMSRNTFLMWLFFGGIGGEFYLSALMMVSFYFPLPERFRWDFWRYIVLLVAANGFWHNVWLWGKIRKGAAEIPWGSIFGGSGDSGGDMNQLNEVYGWSITQIIGTYNRLGHICLLILIGTYVFVLVRQNGSLFRQFYREKNL
jgi:hypothetical protein